MKIRRKITNKYPVNYNPSELYAYICRQKAIIKMIDFPCAKINLGLNITGKRPDGYHDLETVFYPIRLCDRLEIEEIGKAGQGEGICQLSLNGMEISGEANDNLVVKAYRLLKGTYPELPRVSIKLTKRIPSQAGMGGGSSDGAYTIRMLNDMFGLEMSVPEMQALAAKLGADCAFFINPVPSFATGIGEKLSPINVDLAGYHIAIVKPPLMISTKEAFANVTPQKPVTCCKDIVAMPVTSWRDRLTNDFEQSIAPLHPEIAQIKQTLYDLGALYAAMSGSGSAVFGIFKDSPEGLEHIFDKYFITIV